MNTFFTSDTHFGHTGVIKLSNRPFADKQDMAEQLIQNWNNVVSEKDTVYHLGDFAFASRTQTEAIMRRLNGRIHLIMGNHDHSQTRKLALEHFESVRDYRQIKIGDKKIILFHFPILYWNSMHHGSWHLHGHCHSHCGMIRTVASDHHGVEIEEEKIARSMDVGVDAHNYAPIEFEEVRELINSKF